MLVDISRWTDIVVESEEAFW